MNWKKEWHKLRASVEKSNQSDKFMTASIICKWILELEDFTSKLKDQSHQTRLHESGIMKYVNLDWQNYNFITPWFSTEEEIVVLFRNEPSNESTMFQRIRDFLHNIIVFKSNIPCPRCNNDDLRCWTDSINLFYECDNCLYVTDSKLTPINNVLNVHPCSRNELLRFGVLKNIN
jgi:hypothetical protein